MLVVLALELYLGVALRDFETRGMAELAAPTTETPAPSNYLYLGRNDPLDFSRAVAAAGADSLLVFVGDSQGAAARDHGPGYPALVAERLSRSGSQVRVVSLHVGGANAYEQGLLLLTLLREGAIPRAVVWSHSIFSQRKNEIRAEYAAAWRAGGAQLASLAPSVIVPSAGAPVRDDPDQGRRALAVVTAAWDGILSRSATVRFMRRPLWDKGEILRRSPLGRLLPAALRPGTARQFDPPASILRDSARFVGEVSQILRARGVHVVHFVAPINRAASPRPFSARAEEVSYRALEVAARESGSAFLNLIDSMPPERYGTYEDGTPDAFHLDGVAHEELAEEFLSRVESPTASAGRRPE